MMVENSKGSSAIGLAFSWDVPRGFSRAYRELGILLRELVVDGNQ